MNKMNKGIKIINEEVGCGSTVHKGNKLKIQYNLYLNKGEMVQENLVTELLLGDRNIIAGLNYGIEGMREGGRRKFKASPYLCYGQQGVEGVIPANSVLIFDLKLVEILG